ncbi:hypothetical protein LZ31DRAFT_161429 [Colletotrichum somersetense]|nr:hypothetical protein LZ31DRAFT_161429 [Colletotrichum somersetense]
MTIRKSLLPPGGFLCSVQHRQAFSRRRQKFQFRWLAMSLLPCLAVRRASVVTTYGQSKVRHPRLLPTKGPSCTTSPVAHSADGLISPSEQGSVVAV